MQLFPSRITLRKIREKSTEVTDNVKNYYELFQIFRIINFAGKRKKRNLQNPPLLVQYCGYRVENLSETFTGQTLRLGAVFTWKPGYALS